MRAIQCLAGALIPIVAIALAVGADDDSRPRFGKPEYLGDIGESDHLKHLSGIEPSQRYEGVLWTHNDREPELVAIDLSGNILAVITVKGADNVDWEDLTSFEMNEQSYLLIADTGNNKERRHEHDLIVVEEPRRNSSGEFPREVHAEWSIRFRYTHEGRRVNCEAVAVDMSAKRILLLTKEEPEHSETYLYSLPLTRTTDGYPTAELHGRVDSILRATTNDRPARSQPTALDIDRDGSVAVVLTYRHAYAFFRSQEDEWYSVFSASPHVIRLPLMIQPEAICFDHQSKSLIVTSEYGKQGCLLTKRNAPIFRVPINSE
jgi:hypothetical protein